MTPVERTRLGRSSRRLLAAALFVAAAAVGLNDRMGLRGGDRTFWSQSVLSYVSAGERLMHGVPGDVSYHLPSSSVAAALIYGRWAPSTRGCDAFALALLTVLVLAVAGIMELGVPGFAAAALLLAYFPASGILDDYPQWLYPAFVLLVAATASWRAREPSDRTALLLALSIGCSLLFRSPLAFLPPALVLFESVSRRAGETRARRRQALILLLVPYLFLIPWIGMNWAVDRKVTIFEDKEASCNIVSGALGSVETVDGDWRALIPPSSGASNGGVLLWAAGEVLRHPARYAAACLKRAWLVLGRWEFPLSFFAIVALWIRRRRRESRVLAVLTAYVVAVHCLMSVQHGYFGPLRYLLILAASSLFADPETPGAAVVSRASKTVVCGALAAALLLSLYTEGRVLSFASLGAAADPAPALEREAALRPDDGWLLVENGEEELRRGETARAAKSFVRALRLQPENPRIQFDLAKSAAFSGHYKLLSLQPLDYDDSRPELFLLRADAELASGDEAKAIAAVGAARDADEAHAFAHEPSDERAAEIAERLRAAKRSRFPETADSLMRDWPAPDHDGVEALLERMNLKSEAFLLIQRARNLLDHGRVAEASAALREASRLPLSLDELENVIDLRFKLPRKSLEVDAGLARDILARVGALRKEAAGDDETRLIIAEARSFVLFGRTADARKTLVLAALQAAEPRRLRAIAFCYQDDLKDYASALGIFGRLALEYPRETSYLSARGLDEYLAGDAGRAIGTMTGVIDADPSDLPAYLTLGAIYEKLGRAADAEALYQGALTRSRDDGRDGPRRRIEESLRELQAKKKP